MTSLRHSIAFRLFVVTFAAMMLFVGLLLLVLAGGFSSFYEQRQKKDIAADLNSIRDRYALYLQSPENGQVFPPYFNQFQNEYDAELALVMLQGGGAKILISGSSESASGQPDLPIPMPIGKEGETSVYLLPKGPDMEMGEQIRVALEQWRLDPVAYGEVMDKGKTLVYRGDMSGKASEQLIAVTALSGDRGDSGTARLLFAVSSLQPVTHASSVFKDLSLYVFAVAFLFVGLLAVGYAILITRPLRRLNAVAARLARLDFSARSGWKRKDEIGDLSRTFDFLSDNLQRTLAELTSANEKLRRDIENEKRLEKLRREFVAGVSHELKTPLSLIGGYAEGLRDNIGSGAKRERYAEVILEETGRMASIVGDMLDLSHLESGQYSLKREAADVAELLAEAAERAATLGEGKSVRVNVKAPAMAEDQAKPAVADRFRIGQVLTNLVTNAVRHAPGGGALELSAALENGEWTVEVYNEGEPIPAEELPRIWERFYRVDRARTRDAGGTGIGLAIVRQILELHGSRYGARNERSGVTFFFTLRAAEG